MMDVSVEAISEIERALIVELPAEDVDHKVELRLKEAASSVQINGFRRGKVPLREVRRRFGEAVRLEIVAELIDSSYAEALKEQTFTPAAKPEIEILNNQSGSALQYKATVQIFPDIILKSLDQIVVNKPIVDIQSSDVDETIEEIRKQHASWEAKEGVAEEGDQVVLDFVGTLVGGGSFEGNTATDYKLDLGSDDFIPGFEDQLIGAAAGIDVTVNVTFPEDYDEASLRGKDVEFAVTVKAVNSRKLPELDDDFLSSLDIKEGGVDALRAAVHENMSAQCERAVEESIKAQVFHELLKLNPLVVPSALVENEMIRQREEALQRAERQFGVDKNQIKELFPLLYFRERSESSVKIALLISKYVSNNAITADDERIDNKIRSMATGDIDPEVLVKFWRKNESQLEQFKVSVLESMAVEQLMAEAQVTETPVSFKDLITGIFDQTWLKTAPEATEDEPVEQLQSETVGDESSV